MVKTGKLIRDVGVGSRAWAEQRRDEWAAMGFEAFTRPVGFGETGLPRINERGSLNWIVEYRKPKKP